MTRQLFKAILLRWQRPFHRYVFFFLILFLPTQLGKHFWFDFSSVRGIRIDYLAPKIYLTDILVVGLLVGWAWSAWDKRKKITDYQLSIASIFKKIKKKIFFLASAFLFLVITNISFSSQPYLSFYQWLKIFEFILLSFYVTKNFNLVRSTAIWLFGVTVIYSSLLAWAQFLKQSSVGGIFWLLGERTFTVNTPGIAKMDFNGRLLLRPYASFSHPNVLAGYLLVVLTLIILNKVILDKSGSAGLSAIYFWFTVILGIATLIITFSQAVWIVAALSILAGIFWLRGEKRKAGWAAIFLFISSLVAFLFIGLLFSQNEEVQFRQILNQAAVKMFFSSPLWGVGLGGFIPSLPMFINKVISYPLLQPVHNIYLLILAETGMVGLVLFFWFFVRLFFVKLKYKSKKNKKLMLLILSQILILGLVDHYFLTLQQTQLLFAIIVGVVLRLSL